MTAAPATPAPATPAPDAVAPAVIESTARLIEPTAVGYAVVAVVGWAIGLTVLPYVAAAFSVLVVLSSVAATRGRLVLSRDGIKARYVFRTITVGWGQVWQLSVEAGWIHRFVRLRRQDGRRIALPALRAPRFGRAPAFTAGVDLLEQWSLATRPAGVRVNRPHRSRTIAYAIGTAALTFGTVFFDRPWYWLDTASVSQLPDPCAVLTSGPARTLGRSGLAVPSADQSAGLQSRHCEWFGDSALRLTYVRFDRAGLINASGTAAEHLSQVDSAIGPILYSEDGFRHKDLNLGDEGYRETTVEYVKVVARRANAIVIVSYGPTGDPTSAAEVITKVAVDALAVLDPR